MSQTRFIIGFALASLAFVAGGLAVVLILEFGKIPTSPIWNGLAAVTALIAAWLTLGKITGHQPAMTAFIIGGGAWGVIAFYVPEYLHDSYTPVDLGRSPNLAVGIVFFIALAALIVAVLPYWRFRRSLRHVIAGLCLVQAGAVGALGYDVYGVYNPAAPELRLTLGAEATVLTQNITLLDMRDWARKQRTPCDKRNGYVPVMQVSHGAGQDFAAMRADLLGVDIEMKGAIMLGLRDGQGRWTCDVSFGEAFEFTSPDEMFRLPVSVFITGNAAAFWDGALGNVLLTACVHARDCAAMEGSGL